MKCEVGKFTYQSNNKLHSTLVFMNPDITFWTFSTAMSLSISLNHNLVLYINSDLAIACTKFFQCALSIITNLEKKKKRKRGSVLKKKSLRLIQNTSNRFWYFGIYGVFFIKKNLKFPFYKKKKKRSVGTVLIIFFFFF